MSARPAPRRVVDGESARKADLAAIHIAKAALGWDESTYRDVMAARCQGVRSAALLDFASRKAFLAHLQASVRATRPGGKAAAPRYAKPLTPSQRLIWSLWQRLADRKLVRDRTRPALLAFMRRITGVDQLDWLNVGQEQLLIEALKRWLDRGDEPAVTPPAGGA